ncbi:MAG TPA: ABC transporter permease [Terriglobales bacterium]|nr:ABC transporter permease [Terriglobales bacterium]
MTYVLQRLLRSILLLLGVSLLCFLFTEMAPGSFFDEMRLNPQISPETIATLRSQYGMNRPLAVRYSRWLASAIHGDFGYSVAYNAPVAPLLWTRAKNTLLLTLTATFLTWLIGVPLGLLTASARGKFADKVATPVSSFLLSVPEIVLAVGLLALVVRWRVVPVGGMMSLGFEDLSLWKKIRDIAVHMLLPVSILVLGGVAIIERHVRASVIEVLDTPYIQAARGLGIGRVRLLFRHVLPVAANPAISLFGFSIAALLGGSLVVEVVTGWPGLGPLILDATMSRDLYVVIGAVLLSAVFMIAGNLIADLMLLASDPRIRAGESNAT